MPKRVDLTGQRFGRLIVLSKIGYNQHGHAEYSCMCDCGNYHNTLGTYLINNKTRSCCCIKKEGLHGLSKHPIYKTLSGMKSRCYNPKNQDFKDWGGRGITVCDE